MIAKIVSGSPFGGCTAYAYGKDQAEVIAHDGIIPDDPKMAADLAIGLMASSQEKKSEEQDLAPNKKRGQRL